MHELTASRRAQLVAIFLLACVALGVFIAQPRASQGGLERIHIAPALGTSSVREIKDLAEAIAIIEVAGPSRAHWNSGDGRRWGEPGTDSFIYRDTPVTVVRQIRGGAPSAFSLRLVGGVADGVDMDFEAGGPELGEGQRYLVFLEQLDFPTEAGSESSWTAVRLGQGMYRRVKGGWHDEIQGLKVTDTDLESLSE